MKRKLSYRQELAWILAARDGMMDKEIAHAMGCSVSAVKGLIEVTRRKVGAKTPRHLVTLWWQEKVTRLQALAQAR